MKLERLINEQDNLNKYAEDFRTIYNKFLTAIPRVPEMTAAQVKAIIEIIKPIVDEKIIWFRYYEKNPVAFDISLPDMNQFFKYLNGKPDSIGKLKF